MIEVQHLTKRYGRVTAVDDVSFRVERGEILGFLGPNGAGKTTTMRILTGYMPATEGKAIVAGFDVFDQPIEAKRRTGYLPETPPLYPDMTVREYLDLRREDQRRAAAERNARSRDGDGADAHRRHGQPPLRQAVEGLQAARRPGAGAHPQPRRADPRRADRRPRPEADHRDARADQELAGDHTIILSTHILPEVSQTCQRVVIINKGHVVAVDTPDNLTGAAARARETMYVQVDAPRRRRRSGAARRVAGVTRVVDADRRDGDRRLRGRERAAAATSAAISRAPSSRSGWGLLELRPMRMSLEDIFLSLDHDGRAAGRRRAARRRPRRGRRLVHA